MTVSGLAADRRRFPESPGGERQLVSRCLDGDQSAWSELYLKYHPVLVDAAKAGLGQQPGQETAEEVAARVWFHLVANDFLLLRRFRSSRGQLKNYLITICRNQAFNLSRSERRRRRREVQQGPSVATAAKRGRPEEDVLLSGGFVESEFVETLSPREKDFYENSLIRRAPQSHAGGLSQSNVRQLRKRVRDKLLRFLCRRH